RFEQSPEPGLAAGEPGIEPAQLREPERLRTRSTRLEQPRIDEIARDAGPDEPSQHHLLELAHALARESELVPEDLERRRRLAQDPPPQDRPIAFAERGGEIRETCGQGFTQPVVLEASIDQGARRCLRDAPPQLRHGAGQRIEAPLPEVAGTPSASAERSGEVTQGRDAVVLDPSLRAGGQLTER